MPPQLRSSFPWCCSFCATTVCFRSARCLSVWVYLSNSPGRQDTIESRPGAGRFQYVVRLVDERNAAAMLLQLSNWLFLSLVPSENTPASLAVVESLPCLTGRPARQPADADIVDSRTKETQTSFTGTGLCCGMVRRLEADTA